MNGESETFGEELQRFRKEHRLTQREMASLLGISVNHVSVLERGIKKPRASTKAAFVWLSRQENDHRDIVNERALPQEEIYERLWNRLCKLDAKRRTEVISMFFQVLEWRNNR